MAKQPPRIRRSRHRPPEHLRAVPVGHGLPNLTTMRTELQDMTDVLMGRTEPPIDRGVLGLMEVADAYFARASEMCQQIQAGEADGRILKNSQHYKFRTGELRTFMEMAKKAAELGSRRVTAAQIELEMHQKGVETPRRGRAAR